MNTLVDVMARSESDAARVAAANAVLDRAHGKAPQAITGEGGTGPIQHVHAVTFRLPG